MFEFLKNYFRRRSLRRHACNEPTGIVPLGEVRTVAVFLDAEDPSFESCRQELQAFFSENNLPRCFVQPQKALGRVSLPAGKEMNLHSF